MVIVGNFAIIHRGYLDILNKYPGADIFILSENFAKKLYQLEADLRKMPVQQAQTFLSTLKRPTYILEESNLEKIKEAEQIILIDDDVIEQLRKNYLVYHPNTIIENGFFYYPQENVYKTQQTPIDLIRDYNEQDINYMKQAQLLASSSGCFWRQVASIIVKENKIIYQAFNQMLPNKDECYKIGCIRDQIKPGTKTEFCSAVHSEAYCIAQAALEGQALYGASIYVTTFPCPACAKLIALAGIKKCFYAEGWANFDGERIMQATGMQIIKIDL